MLPVIALVGRPNVGKSTLFNRLTRSRDALVADRPGLTRDRQYGVGQLGDRPYLVVDTGGLSNARSGLELLMEEQALQAVREADHVLLLVDGREGLTAADQAVADQLRRYDKPITLVVNKVDGMDALLACNEFHGMGLNPTPIAAAQGRGVGDLVDGVLGALEETGPDVETNREQTAPGILVAVVGRPNVGKSTLINRMLGEQRVLTSDEPGATRDSIFVPFERAGVQYTLIDTAGVRRRARVTDVVEKFSVIKTLQAIERTQVVILALDARQGIGEQDARLTGLVLDSGRALVLAVNKWDGLTETQRQTVRRDLERKLSFLDLAAPRFISALHGSGVGELFAEVQQAHAAASKKHSTPQLNKILENAVQAHPPPLAHGRRIKLRYAHQGGQNPPVIVIHGNQTSALPATYRRYLANSFRTALGLVGRPAADRPQERGESLRAQEERAHAAPDQTP